MSPTRLQGLAWRQEAEIRLAHVRARNEAAKAGHRGMVTVIRMPVRDWHAEHFGSFELMMKFGISDIPLTNREADWIRWIWCARQCNRDDELQSCDRRIQGI